MLITKLLDKCSCSMIRSASWIQTHPASCQLEMEIAKFQTKPVTLLLHIYLIDHSDSCSLSQSQGVLYKVPFIFHLHGLFCLQTSKYQECMLLLCKCGAKSLFAIVFIVAMLTVGIFTQCVLLLKLLLFGLFSTLSCVQISICYSWQQY